MKFLSKPFPLLVVLILCLLFFSIPPATTAAPASQAFPTTTSWQVPVLLGPEQGPYRLPPARRLYSPDAPTATITANYLPAGANQHGYTCQNAPAQLQTAFNYAASLWANLLQSAVPIRVDVCWADMGATNILGMGGPSAVRDFAGVPMAGTWYAFALADSLAGSDLYPGNPDARNTFNTQFSWYFGTDGNPVGQVDFVSVALHELGHGLGFVGGASVSSGTGYLRSSGYPYVYARFTEDGAGTSLLNYTDPSASLGTVLQSNNIYFDGSNANAANGGNRVKLYAPGTWSQGSSYSHLDYATFGSTSNRLMVYMISTGQAIHNPGPVTLGIMKDIGWQMVASCFTLSTSVSPGGAGSVNANPSPNCNGTQYNSGSVVTLTASANGGYTFFGWAGDAGGTINPTTVTMSTDRNVIASFNPASFIPKYIFLPLLKK